MMMEHIIKVYFYVSLIHCMCVRYINIKVYFYDKQFIMKVYFNGNLTGV